MNLSMWILADRFAHYECSYDIEQGEQGICGVRIFSEELPSISHEYVYVGRAADVFDGAGYENAVLLVHGHDTMFVRGISVDGAVNEILSAFDYYNSWESRLWSASTDGDPIQALISIADEILSGPLSVADNDGNILARSMKYGPDDIDDRWKYTCETMQTPLDTTSAPIMTPEGKLLSDWTSYPKHYWLDYGFFYIGGYLCADGEAVAAFLYQEHEKTLNPGDCQLCAVLWRVLESALQRSGDMRARSSASLLTQLLSHGELDEPSIERMNRQLPGQPPWALVALRNIMSSENMPRKQRLLVVLREITPNCIATIYESDVVAVVSYSDLSSFLEQVQKHIVAHYYVIGVSMPFSQWADSPIRYNQADFAIGCAKGKPGVYYSADYSFRQLLENIRQGNRNLALLHPALELLRSYDEAHGTQLYESLFVYLRCERNIVAAASQLFLHRNSMAYRVQRIEALTGSDFDDFDTRAHVLISYLIGEEAQWRSEHSPLA